MLIAFFTEIWSDFSSWRLCDVPMTVGRFAVEGWPMSVGDDVVVVVLLLLLLSTTTNRTIS
jgi:hypothetical protein